MRQLAARGDPAALGPAASTVPWATCLAVRTLYNASLEAVATSSTTGTAVAISSTTGTPPDDSTSGSLSEILVRYLAVSATESRWQHT